jgi:hypothetical protein
MPNCTMKPGIMRKKRTPEKYPIVTSSWTVGPRHAGAFARVTSTVNGPLLVSKRT